MKSFVLIATQRSGTTAFRACLNACPDVEMYGEAFFPGLFDWGYYTHLARTVAEDPGRVLPAARAGNYADYLSSLRDRHPRHHVGIDVKYSDMEANPGLFAALGAQFDVVIHMRRRNILRTILSNESMKQRVERKLIGESQIHSAKVAPKVQVTLDPDRIVGQIDALERQIARHDGVLEERFADVVRLTYETTFVQTGDRTSLAPEVHGAVCAALELDTAEDGFRCDLRKQNIWPLHEMIENFDAIAAVLNRSRYYHMLEF